MSEIYYPPVGGWCLPVPPYHRVKKDDLLKKFRDKNLVLFHAKEIVAILEYDIEPEITDKENKDFFLEVYKEIIKEISEE